MQTTMTRRNVARLTMGMTALLATLAAPAALQAAPLVGGTMTLRMSDIYYDHLIWVGAQVEPEGLAQAVPGDPRTFVMPITADETTGREDGFAAIGSGVSIGGRTLLGDPGLHRVGVPGQ